MNLVAALEAQRSVELRDRRLNPPAWVECVDEPVPGYPKRPVPHDEDAANTLKKRPDGLYNPACSDSPMHTRSLTPLWPPRTVGQPTLLTTTLSASCWRPTVADSKRAAKRFGPRREAC